MKIPGICSFTVKEKKIFLVTKIIRGNEIYKKNLHPVFQKLLFICKK